MATKLPKLQGSEVRENKNCGNQVAENGREKKNLWQPRCQKLGEKFNSNLGNEVAEMEGKKKCCNGFVAMELPKIGERERERVHIFLF